MSALPLVTSEGALLSQIMELVKASKAGGDDLVLLKTVEEAVDFLDVEMPELVFVNFSDKKLNAFAFLDEVLADPWLHHGGIIALCDDYETVTRLEDVHGANIVVIIMREDIERHLTQVMNIIHDNRRILFQREIGIDLVENISGSFKMNNDPYEASCYANLICNFLYNTNRIDTERKGFLYFALNELLLNAIEHGNCGITYDEKSAHLGTGGYISELIEQRAKLPEVVSRKVTFEYTISPSRSKFFIADDGNGFDWKSIKDPSEDANLMALHGRGIMVARKFTENLAFNEEGNAVTFEFAHQKDAAITPSLFGDIEPIEVQDGDIIFQQGESSNYLYYIVKGSYDVIVNGKAVSSLAEDDVFMGEMAFLLNNKRSAVVQASSKGKLIKISKQEFVEAIKHKPHYALFLSRLLAQRIQRLNLRSAAK